MILLVLDSNGYDIKLHQMVRLQFWARGNVQYTFIIITPWSTLNRSASTREGTVFELYSMSNFTMIHDFSSRSKNKTVPEYID